MSELVGWLFVWAFVSLVGVGYFSTRLFRCPDCGFRSDVDHVVEVSGEAPYCAYCGSHTDYIGRKIDAWRARVVGEDLSVICKAEDVESEGVLQKAAATFVRVVKR